MVIVSGGRLTKGQVVTTNQEKSAHPITEMSAKAVLKCRANSHPFQERILILNTPAKVGRSVARARPASNNAIFDCKVLSRHHALLWFENGQFLLQDTKSSNGTFVNNTRLSEGGNESLPKEIHSGDILQFGVDVVENNRRVTHGCVIMTVKLYLPDGSEEKANTDDLYRLAQHLKEAARREHQLETKLLSLQCLVEQTKQAAELGWRAAVDEDRLLSRVAVLESQLRAYSKATGDDSIREELLRLQEDKNAYQNAAKDSLQRLHKERLDALDKVTVLERATISAETERTVAVEQCLNAQEDLRQLAIQLSESHKLTKELTEKLALTEQGEIENQKLITKIGELEEGEKALTLSLDEWGKLHTHPDLLTTLKGKLRKLQEKLDENPDNLIEISTTETMISRLANCKKLEEQINFWERIKNEEFHSEVCAKDHKTEINSISVIPKVQEDELNEVESKLKVEIEEKEVMKKENENLREKLIETEQMLKESKNESQQLRDKVDSLLLQLENKSNSSTPEDTVEKTKLDLIISTLQQRNLSLEEELARLSHREVVTSSNDQIRISDLEEELVLVKESHAKCIPERTQLQTEIEHLGTQLNALNSRTNTVVFCYTAPLVLIIAYLLINTIFA